MEKKYPIGEHPSSSYQPLFDHMLQEHGLTLLESEMADIIHVVGKMQQVPQGAGTTVYVPCLENDPRACGGYTSGDGRSLCYVRESTVPVIEQGPGWVKAKPVKDGFYPVQYAGGGYGGCGFKDGEWNQGINDSMIVAYLNESGQSQPGGEMTPDELWDEFSQATDYGSIVMTKDGFKDMMGKMK